jgi:hypothetical protein
LGTGFPNPTYVGLWDGPSQYFFSWGGNGYEYLSTPFTVTAASSTSPSTSVASAPEPAIVPELVTMLMGVAAFAFLFKRKMA